jgi:creatinine amidohydrolase
MTHRIEELTMEEFRARVGPRTVVLVPVGILEGHGAHLPLSTDTIQAIHVCDRIAEAAGDVLVAPTVHYGACSSTANFPGSISMSFDTVRALFRDILSEMHRQGVRNVAVISGHAGRNHIAAINEAAREVALAHEDMHVMALSDYDLAYERLGKEFAADDGHAGDVETSRVLAIRPDLVKGRGAPSQPDLPRWAALAHPERRWTTATWGDPTRATAEKGQRLNDWIVGELVKHIEAMRDGWPARPG